MTQQDKTTGFRAGGSSVNSTAITTDMTSPFRVAILHRSNYEIEGLGSILCRYEGQKRKRSKPKEKNILGQWSFIHRDGSINIRYKLPKFGPSTLLEQLQQEMVKQLSITTIL